MLRGHLGRAPGRSGVVANAGGPKKFFRPPRKAGKTYRQPDWLIEQQAAQLLAKELGDDDDLSINSRQRDGADQRSSRGTQPWGRDQLGSASAGGAGQTSGQRTGPGASLAAQASLELGHDWEDWGQPFLLTNRQRKALVEARRQRLFGRNWRQRDVRFYLLWRARHAPAYTALLRSAGPEMAAVADALQAWSRGSKSSTSTRSSTGGNAGSGTSSSATPSADRNSVRGLAVFFAAGEQARSAAASADQAAQPPPPKLRLPRQRGGAAFDDSLPRPQTWFKLPLRWRLRVLGERVTALRAALPSLHAAEAAGLYLGAPTMLCYPSTEVARRLRALASLLRCSYASAVQLVVQLPLCGVVGADVLAAKATRVAKRLELTLAGTARLLACRPELLSAPVPVLLERCELLAWLLGMREAQALQLLARAPAALVTCPPDELQARVAHLRQLLLGQVADGRQGAGSIGAGTGAGNPAAPSLNFSQAEAPSTTSSSTTTATTIARRNGAAAKPETAAGATLTLQGAVQALPQLLALAPQQLRDHAAELGRVLGVSPSQAVALAVTAPGLMSRPLWEVQELAKCLGSKVGLAGAAEELQPGVVATEDKTSGGPTTAAVVQALSLAPALSWVTPRELRMAREVMVARLSRDMLAPAGPGAVTASTAVTAVTVGPPGRGSVANALAANSRSAAQAPAAVPGEGALHGAGPGSGEVLLPAAVTAAAAHLVTACLRTDPGVLATLLGMPTPSRQNLGVPNRIGHSSMGQSSGPGAVAGVPMQGGSMAGGDSKGSALAHGGASSGAPVPHSLIPKWATRYPRGWRMYDATFLQSRPLSQPLPATLLQTLSQPGGWQQALQVLAGRSRQAGSRAGELGGGAERGGRYGPGNGVLGVGVARGSVGLVSSGSVLRAGRRSAALDQRLRELLGAAGAALQQQQQQQLGGPQQGPKSLPGSAGAERLTASRPTRSSADAPVTGSAAGSARSAAWSNSPGSGGSLSSMAPPACPASTLNARMAAWAVLLPSAQPSAVLDPHRLQPAVRALQEEGLADTLLPVMVSAGLSSLWGAVRERAAAMAQTTAEAATGGPSSTSSPVAPAPAAAASHGPTGSSSTSLQHQLQDLASILMVPPSKLQAAAQQLKQGLLQGISPSQVAQVVLVQPKLLVQGPSGQAWTQLKQVCAALSNLCVRQEPRIVTPSKGGTPPAAAQGAAAAAAEVAALVAAFGPMLLQQQSRVGLKTQEITGKGSVTAAPAQALHSLAGGGSVQAIARALGLSQLQASWVVLQAAWVWASEQASHRRDSGSSSALGTWPAGPAASSATSSGSALSWLTSQLAQGSDSLANVLRAAQHISPDTLALPATSSGASTAIGGTASAGSTGSTCSSLWARELAQAQAASPPAAAAQALACVVRHGERWPRLNFLLASSLQDSISFQVALSLAPASFAARFPAYSSWAQSQGLALEPGLEVRDSAMSSTAISTSTAQGTSSSLTTSSGSNISDYNNPSLASITGTAGARSAGPGPAQLQQNGLRRVVPGYMGKQQEGRSREGWSRAWRQASAARGPKAAGLSAGPVSGLLPLAPSQASTPAPSAPSAATSGGASASSPGVEKDSTRSQRGQGSGGVGRAGTETQGPQQGPQQQQQHSRGQGRYAEEQHGGPRGASVGQDKAGDGRGQGSGSAGVRKAGRQSPSVDQRGTAGGGQVPRAGR